MLSLKDFIPLFPFLLPNHPTVSNDDMGKALKPDDRRKDINDSKDISLPNNSNNTSGPRSRSTKHNKYLIITIAVVIVVGVVAASIVLLESNHHLRVGIITDSMVSNITGRRLIVSSTNTYPFHPLNAVPVKALTTFFNASNHSGFIAIGSLEFSNGATATGFYNDTCAGWILFAKHSNFNPIIENDSYDGFSFSSLTVSNQVLIIVGHSGSFAFIIFDSYLPLPNTTSLIHSEIRAMIG